jgi:tripartite-type tricarboxylate transporter receptor subunit TctC
MAPRTLELRYWLLQDCIISTARTSRVEREEASMPATVRLTALVVLCAMAGHAACGAACGVAWAQGDADFFRNKTVKLTITFEPGGSYDLYARLAATHLPKHLPGQPAMTVQYQPGAGGLIGILHFAEKAAQDGTELAILPRDVAINQRLRPETAKYDVRRFNWIGTLATYPGVMFIAARTGVKTAEDLRRIPIVAGSWGPTSETFITPTLLNALADTRFKIVSGYRGGPDVDLAVERGEADGRMASWTLLKTQRAQWLRDKFVVIPFQAGVTSHPELADVPLIGTLAKTEEGRRIFEFQNSDAGIGWSVVAPPNVPPERVALLRRAFDAMAADPEFRADADKRGLDVTPARGEALAEIVNRTIATPAEALVTLKSILGIQ